MRRECQRLELCRRMSASACRSRQAGITSTRPRAASRLHQLVEHRQILRVRNGTAVPRPRLVRDHEIEDGNHGDVLTDGAQPGVGAAIRPGRERAA